MATRGPVEPPSSRLSTVTSESVSQLVRPSGFQLHADRFRQHLDTRAVEFFESLSQLGRVTIVNYGPNIAFSSVLSLEDAS